jgi:cytochrome c oxidase subunit 2
VTRRRPGLVAPLALLATPAAAATPLSYLTAAGPKAARVLSLTWGLLAISIAVVVIVTVLVVVGVLLRRTRDVAIANVPVERGGDGLRWIWIGLAASAVPLLAALVWTISVLAAINEPRIPAALTIEVTAQQWWWKARYLNGDASRVFITANEIHIPTGQPVRFQLIGADVIHSFWVPALGGKTEMIPGQTNVTWLQAKQPGRYRGQCSEFCGTQHAHMGFLIVADAPAAFELWEDQQIEPAPAPATAEIAQGEALFEYRCGACHTVRGSGAGGSVAPDLTHLMSRTTLAAATLPHNTGTLSGWIADPQAIKPGALMPVLDVTGPELQSLRTYLATLR